MAEDQELQRVLEHIARSPVARRDVLRRGAVGLAGILGVGALGTVLEACGSSSSSKAAAPKSSSKALEPATAAEVSALVAAAKKEGHLNVIALPSDWANYGNIMKTFKAKYGISISDASPDDSSSEELQAIKSLKGQSRAPDAVDVAPPFAVSGATEGLFAPYKVETWDSIPSDLKDPNGMWYGDYYGVISFGTNTKVVKNPPETWDDLLKPEYKGMVTIDGNPTTAGDAQAAVMAASLANGGSLDDIEPGIEFFVKLKKVGNFNPTDNYPANIAKGSTPIAIKWDYLNLGYKEQFKGNPPFHVSIPPTGVYGGYYAQAISATAPNPSAARLWEEFLYSNEGQLLYLAGLAHPARYNYLAEHNLIPESLAKKLPPASAYKKAQFATVAQLDKAAKVLQAQWGPKMGVS